MLFLNQFIVYIKRDMNILIILKQWKVIEISNSTQAISVEYFENIFIPNWFSSFFIESFLHGNLDKEDSFKIVNDIEKLMIKKNSSPIFRCQFPDERIIQLPTGKDVLVQMKEINKENSNSAIEMIYQIGANVNELNALLSVFCQIVESPFYEKLRTVEQIGYLVFSRPRYDHNVISFSIIIQSSDKDPIYIQKKCEEFFDSFLNEIKEMKIEDFNQHVKSCIEKNKEKDKQLGEETTRHWNEICFRQYKFFRREENIKALEKVTQKDLIIFFNKYISNQSDLKKRLIVQVFSSAHYEKIKNEEKENVVYVTSVDDFKNCQSTFPSKL
jgi:secreted Zn-dependent insulinase-like peptidase